MHVRLEGVAKRFGAVRALDGADFEAALGEVHGLLGANGAGKTTLLNVLGGLLAPDAGRIIVAGEEVSIGSPRDARRLGISFVHQHFTLVPAFTVLENLALGVGGAGGAGRAGGRLDLAGVRRRTEALVQRTGLDVPLDAPCGALGVGDRQRTEILKALLPDPRVIVLDEPTAVLAPPEVDALFALLRTLAGEGRAVVLVAHKLDEVLGVADRVTVLRAGRTVLRGPARELDTPTLVRAMIGSADPEGGPAKATAHSEAAGGAREAGREAEPAAGAPDASLDSSPPVATLRGVTVRRADGSEALRDVDLEVRRGEIVGIAGVEANGQRELALVLSGRLAPTEGSTRLPEGVGFIPQDRTTEGLIADFDLAENVALALHREPELSRGPWLRWEELRRRAEGLRVEYGVAADSVRTRAGALSGGNQQRVVVGRELSMARDLLVAENPTRGLDVSAAAFVHARLRALRSGGPDGPGVVLLSTDLDEVLALADRVLVASRGRLGPVPEESRTPDGIGALMLAGADSASAARHVAVDPGARGSGDSDPPTRSPRA